MSKSYYERFPVSDFPGSANKRVRFFSSECIDEADYVARHRQGQVDRARELRQTFEAGSASRQRELRKLLKYRHRYNTVLVMTLNRGFSDLLQNWVASCDRHGIEVRSWTLIAAMDEETAQQFESMGFAVYLSTPAYGNPSPDSATVFGDLIFKDMMFAKTAVVQDVLSIGHDVLFQDVDMVWKKDPAEFLLRPERHVLDAQFMYDGPNSMYAPLHANSGFFFLRNNERSRIFWQQVFDNFDKVFAYGGQQMHVNMLLVTSYFRGLKLDILKEAEFANGHLFSNEDVSSLPTDPYVIHCSWTRNLEHKMEKYRLANIWYLQ
jgi:hypothetical protein